VALAKIRESDIMVQYPSATIDLDYVSKLKDRFDGAVLEQRVNILVDEVRAAGYNKSNIGEYAVIDTARARKVHFFLTNLKYKKKMTTKIISRIKMRFNYQNRLSRWINM